MARSDPQVNLRLPALLKERLEAASAKSGRSVNAEIVQRLDDSLREETASTQFVEARLREYEALLMALPKLKQDYSVCELMLARGVDDAAVTQRHRLLTAALEELRVNADRVAADIEFHLEALRERSQTLQSTLYETLDIDMLEAAGIKR
jgi:hypothetical protein